MRIRFIIVVNTVASCQLFSFDPIADENLLSGLSAAAVRAASCSAELVSAPSNFYFFISIRYLALLN